MKAKVKESRPVFLCCGDDDKNNHDDTVVEKAA